jgi:hypothetical protein
MTMDNASSENKGLTIGDRQKNPLKKAHRLENKTFVVIDENLVKHLAIDENNTWFEQLSTEDGILLKVRRKEAVNYYE